MEDSRVTHYWDEHAFVGSAFAQHIENLQSPVWDIWMLFAPGVEWGSEAPPKPTWWEHQLNVLNHLPERRLDPDRLAAKALEISRKGD